MLCFQARVNEENLRKQEESVAKQEAMRLSESLSPSPLCLAAIIF